MNPHNKSYIYICTHQLCALILGLIDLLVECLALYLALCHLNFLQVEYHWEVSKDVTHGCVC